jgi:CDK-activating kinase assembly factor MAT1
MEGLIMIVFNLVNGTALKETETKVADYEAANRGSIATNAARIASENATVLKQEEYARHQREQARLAAIQEEAEERHERERQKTDLIRDLASSEGSADKILARNKAAALKRSSSRRINDETRTIGNVPNLSMLRIEDVEMEEEVPFDPLGGQGAESSLYVVRQNYDDSYVSFWFRLIRRWLDQVKNDKVASAGGFVVHDVYKRGLFEAYTGLGCILAAELTGI